MSRRRRRSSSPVDVGDVAAVEADRALGRRERRSTARPNVVLPEPLSPTRPSVSPRCDRQRHVVDGVDELRGPAPEPLRPTGKRIDRCSTSTSASSTARVGAARPLCREPAWTVLTPRPRRWTASGSAEPPRTAASRRPAAPSEWSRRPGVGVEALLRRRARQRGANAHPMGGRNEIGWSALDRHQPRHHDVEARRAAQQARRVRVAGSRVERRRRARPRRSCRRTSPPPDRTARRPRRGRA